MSDEPSQTLNLEWIDEIPTRASVRKSRVVACATAMLAVLGLWFWHVAGPALNDFLLHNAAAQVHLQKMGLLSVIRLWGPLFGFLGALCGVCGLLGLLRTKATYQLLRLANALVCPAVLVYTALVWFAVFSLLSKGVPIDGAKQNRVAATFMWWHLSWPALAVGVYSGWLLVMLHSRSVYAAFTGRTGQPMRGDEILEDWRTHGRDPRARRSLYASITTHVMILILIPYLLQMHGCVEAYRVPKGSGTPTVAMVQIVKPKKQKKRKKLALRPNSAILYDVPDLDNTSVDQVMNQKTQATYQASVNAKAGKMGKGGGKKGGWPQGMENYKIRFIRLKHSGQAWDDGMNVSGADINFLHAFADATGFDNIASSGEAIRISTLARYPDDGFPPFVYLTGNGPLGYISASDRKILRVYCLKGGMLIADAGSEGFNRSFHALMRQVFPGKPLLDISDDDMIYRIPYAFPNGAPAFWHHGGTRALGIKDKGRWIVFYTPGDMNDAWKSPGYSNVTPEMRKAAIHLGINLVYYAFTHWNDAVAKLKK